MSFLGLFEGIGIELEYMLVDSEKLDIRPISDEIMKDAAGKIVSDFDDGDIMWSNELVLHVMELKTNGPAKSLDGLENSFLRSLKKLHSLLEKHHARLMPTAMHPFMHPDEMKLWPHDYSEIYESYDRIFGCHGHGWSNLQSMHINLPFRDSAEFERLHTAIRFLLPILPALAASSPVVEGQLKKAKDNRLLYYQQNQARVPSIAGLVIPEAVHSIDHYHESILRKIYSDIAPHDPEENLREDWLNSRGAIARFERQTIEIRVLDLQETPAMDLAIADFIVSILKYLVLLPDSIRKNQHDLPTEGLKTIFDACILFAEAAPIVMPDYLKAWSAPNSITTVNDLMMFIFNRTPVKTYMSKVHAELISELLQTGSLATRISRALGDEPQRARIQAVYRKLCDCLDNNQTFQP